MAFLEKVYQKSPIFLQTLMVNGKAFELYLERYGKKFWKVFEEFDKNQWLSENEIEECQSMKLRLLVRHAYETVPYYRNIMDCLKLSPNDIKEKRDLFKLPVLTKDDIKKNFHQLISSEFKGLKLRHGHTSGTTGTPLDLCYNVKTCVVHHVADWRQKYWAGMVYGEPFASIQGRVIAPIAQKKPPFWRKNYINKQLFLSSFHLKEENIPYYFEALKKEGIRIIEGYPSNVYILAMYLSKNKRTFPLKAVLTSSETLFDYQREAVEKAFECKVFDFYGMAERVVFATECEQHSGHHLNLDYGITEFLDSKNEPVEQGKMGRIVATGLYNFAMPLIRYQTNDTSAMKAYRCSCGRGFPLMEDVATKDESIITLPDGRLISPSVLTHPFKPMHNIAESQIIQEEIDKLLLRIVKREGYTNEDEARLIKAFHERLGAGIRIGIEYLEKIPKTQGQKFKWVISKIKPQI